mgnify:CR=1 FL=1
MGSHEVEARGGKVVLFAFRSSEPLDAKLAEEVTQTFAGKATIILADLDRPDKIDPSVIPLLLDLLKVRLSSLGALPLLCVLTTDENDIREAVAFDGEQSCQALLLVVRSAR